MHKTHSFFKHKIIKAEESSLQFADKIIAYSPACKEYLIKEYALKNDINILPSLLFKPIQPVKVESENFNIGFIGSFLSWHKVDLLVCVFKKFYQVYPNARLLLIGYGEEWNNVKLLVNELGIEDYVELPGFVTEEELTNYKSQFTVGVMAGSNWYGSPLKLFEYAFAGIPFIAPDSKTVLSIFEDKKHCLYVEGADEEATLFNALETYYLDAALREEHSLEVSKYVNNDYSLEIYRNSLFRFLADSN